MAPGVGGILHGGRVHRGCNKVRFISGRIAIVVHQKAIGLHGAGQSVDPAFSIEKTSGGLGPLVRGPV